jgi:hypothetical protein
MLVDVANCELLFSAVFVSEVAAVATVAAPAHDEGCMTT